MTEPFTPTSTPDPVHRTLHTHPNLQIYAVPPLRPGAKGYTSRVWMPQAPIFTARLEIVEVTSIVPTIPATPATTKASAEATPASGATPARSRTTPTSTNTTNSPASAPTPHSASTSDAEGDNTPTTTTVSISIRLLDPLTNELFAAAPYTHPAAVTPCIDSGRFFALRVADESGRKATLGIGFEEREGAFEFLEGLGRAGRVVGFGGESGVGGLRNGEGGGGMGRVVRDLSGKGDRVDGERDDSALFAIAPPPPPAGGDLEGYRAGEDEGSEQRSLKTTNDEPPDDDDFGEFQ